MSDKINQAICSRIKEAIADERSASPMYKRFILDLHDAGLLTRFDESRLKMIIEDEENHEKYFMGLAQKVGCKISQETIQEERYYKKPLSERIALAKKIVEGMEK